jgi:hypothetical protein
MQEVLTLSSRRILASQSMKEDDPLRIVRPESGGFLPPIISFAAARMRALEEYENVSPEPLVHDAVKERLKIRGTSGNGDRTSAGREDRSR